MEQLECLYTDVGSVNQYNHFGKTVCHYVIKLKACMLYYSGISELEIFPKQTYAYILIEHDTCNSQKLPTTQILVNSRVNKL